MVHIKDNPDSIKLNVQFYWVLPTAFFQPLQNCGESWWMKNLNSNRITAKELLMIWSNEKGCSGHSAGRRLRIPVLDIVIWICQDAFELGWGLRNLHLINIVVTSNRIEHCGIIYYIFRYFWVVGGGGRFLRKLQDVGFLAMLWKGMDHSANKFKQHKACGIVVVLVNMVILG